MHADVLGVTVAVLLGYLLGSVSFAHVIARRATRGEVEELRYGGAGASTMYRVLGARAGVLVVLGDFAKSALAVTLAQKLVSPQAGMLAGAAAVAGHNWPIFHGFHGGRGAAAAAGALLALVPLALGLGLVVAAVAFIATRNMFITTTALFLPAVTLAWALAYPTWSVAYSVALPGVVVVYTWLAGRRVPLRERFHRTSVRWKGPH